MLIVKYSNDKRVKYDTLVFSNKDVFKYGELRLCCEAGVKIVSIKAYKDNKYYIVNADANNIQYDHIVGVLPYYLELSGKKGDVPLKEVMENYEKISVDSV